MALTFDAALAARFTNSSQKARVLTEAWMARHGWCPNCGHEPLLPYPNNRQVADLFCRACGEDFELKSQQGRFGRRIAAGSHGSMIARLGSATNPNLMLLAYSPADGAVTGLTIVPKQFFTASIISQRPPLALTARRAGWVGCNIMLDGIPAAGRITVIADGALRPRADVMAEWRRTLFLRQEAAPIARGWLLATIAIIERIGRPEFTLRDLYAFESELAATWPGNNNIRAKLRQQLQRLRDGGFLTFAGAGRYRLTATRSSAG